MIFVIGSTVLLAGVVLLVTPGPALLVIPTGLGILGIEFAWARQWLRKVKQTAVAAKNKVIGGEEKEGIASSTGKGGILVDRSRDTITTWRGDTAGSPSASTRTYRSEPVRTFDDRGEPLR